MPAVNPNTDLKILLLLGKILVHGFMVCGFLPVRLAFPVICSCNTPWTKCGAQ